MTSSTVAEAPEMFQRAVNALVARPNFLAHVLAAAFAGDVSAKRIAGELGCTETNALRLAMMTVPRSQGRQFRDDVSRIASAAGIDPWALLPLIRQARALAAFDPNDNAEGMLLAARDVVPDSEDGKG